MTYSTIVGSATFAGTKMHYEEILVEHAKVL